MAKQKINPVEYCDIAVPVQLAIPQAQFGYRFDVKIGSDDGYALRQLTQGLKDAGAKLNSGVKVDSATHAIVWLVQQVGGAADSIDFE